MPGTAAVPDPCAPPEGPWTAIGPRVALRPFTPEDGPGFTAAARASTALHHPWLAPPRTAGEYTAYLDRLGEPARAGFLLCARDTGRIAGFITVNNIVHGAFRCGALGYGVFAHAAGRGLMGEGLRLLLRHAFGPLGLHRLEANIQPGNAASLRLVRRAGFRLEGFSPAFLLVDGAWRDHERWALTADMPVPPAGDFAEE
ncbi:GNAT family protein [Streptomyces sp. NPDC000594]|uniref:GNAT family N-acetyltransferase n=1 Tax=Streptomyces sp. NPDC000594 TaxID=3154261 RepID=UPI0033316487